MNNPLPIIPEEICRIFLVWAAAGEYIAAPLQDSPTKRQLLEACQTLKVLGHHGNETELVLIDPPSALDSILWMVDNMGKSPFVPGANTLNYSSKVRAWVRAQRTGHYHGVMPGRAEAEAVSSQMG
jgi:hypothetical protein